MYYLCKSDKDNTHAEVLKKYSKLRKAKEIREREQAKLTKSCPDAITTFVVTTSYPRFVDRDNYVIAHEDIVS